METQRKLYLVIIRSGEVKIDLEEVGINGGSELIGVSLAEALIPDRTGLIVPAIKRCEGETEINPRPPFVLSEGDSLIILGKEEQGQKLRELANEKLYYTVIHQTNCLYL